MSNEEMIIKVLAEEGNMRKAAERLFLSQPALSQRLQSIEKEWGQQLFVRSQKGLTPTPAGELVIQYAKEAVMRREEIFEQLHTLSEKVHGTLKIACASIIGQNWLPKVLKDFITLYPEAKVQLITGWSSEIVRALYDGEAHIGIVRGQTDWKGPKIHLFKDTLYLVDKEISSLEEVMKTERPFIQFKSDSTYYEEIQQWWQKHFASNPKRQITVDQIETCKQMAVNGIGYAILPSITLTGAEDVHTMPLTNSEQELELTRDTWLIGYESSFQLRQVEAFVDIVKKHATLLS
ncbi:MULTISPECIES: LysR family transcriptional regulator [unclassified Planococcus (in: firmicutes)]|uniref:LysR family transcriptional regulator n=1 Tax=Planococcus TaxID=1372 RepID=UPI000C330C33|nr:MULTISPECIES: LysR family transcriptional regulator [unclassified Planococcus (in: firmicutes)]AUD14223.1 LysR family transcriptional regulator [Planococcus sp. MB-3u-03]PKG48253.1 LysR family transcriptional regulator [Planococcus sp. Urea-trap-24]PKG92100.1 LysR family transcriptional regulator [Planococcus sp. Urea-3u-39]PKH42995.1 LysR family transcriptional regulator [Planococcus sp. MB-3u-09]